MIDLEENKRIINNLKDRIENIYNSLNLKSKEEALKQLESKTLEEGFWNNSNESNLILKQIKDIKSKIKLYTDLNAQISDLSDLNELLNIEPDEELERNMYWYVKNTLENNGYIHYEISNFAKEGHESKHNISCWKQEEYIGFGVNAHSYVNSIRYSNKEIIEDYIEDFDKIVHEKQSIEDMQKEYMLLGLRKIKGISVQEFKNKFGENPIFLFRNELSKLVEEDLLEVDGDIIKLTNKGLDLANQVWQEFI